MKKILVIAALLVLGGCSGQEEPEPTPPAQGQSRVPDSNVFSDQVRALERAEGVEQTIKDAAEQQRQAIEAQTGQ
ncbi:hypothetical protein [Thiohalobacter sp.]|uniref:hypothetical protein n=1 Tax=Thiohalobacter sp. TaxID=2025948 RepID=UPI002627D4A5|nr:hypothetical protein [Thiohalobacter sp.]